MSEETTEAETSSDVVTTLDPDADRGPQEAYLTRQGGSRGYQGLFKISTLVIGDTYDPTRGDYSEKEIDVDDRSVKLQFTIEMGDNSPWRFKAVNLHVVVRLKEYIETDAHPRSAGEMRIAMGVVDNGATTEFKRGDGEDDGLVVFDRKDGYEIFPGQALHKILQLRTGIFSETPYNGNSADPGPKEFPVEIDYDLAPFDNDTIGESNAHAFFLVTAD